MGPKMDVQHVIFALILLTTVPQTVHSTRRPRQNNDPTYIGDNAPPASAPAAPGSAPVASGSASASGSEETDSTSNINIATARSGASSPSAVPQGAGAASPPSALPSRGSGSTVSDSGSTVSDSGSTVSGSGSTVSGSGNDDGHAATGSSTTGQEETASTSRAGDGGVENVTPEPNWGPNNWGPNIGTGPKDGKGIVVPAANGNGFGGSFASESGGGGNGAGGGAAPIGGGGGFGAGGLSGGGSGVGTGTTIARPGQVGPIPGCYINDSGYMCCNSELEQILLGAQIELDRIDPGKSSCNTLRQARYIQERAQKFFGTDFETIVALDDFAFRTNFLGNMTCKVEVAGKYILGYATPDKTKVDKYQIYEATTANPYIPPPPPLAYGPPPEPAYGPPPAPAYGPAPAPAYGPPPAPAYGPAAPPPAPAYGPAAPPAPTYGAAPPPLPPASNYGPPQLPQISQPYLQKRRNSKLTTS